jgi:hypothetical protein
MGGEFRKLAGCALVKMQVELSRISCTTAKSQLLGAPIYFGAPSAALGMESDC